MRDIFEGIQDLDDLLSSPDLVGEEAAEEPAVRAEPEPIGYVTRELTGPDGSTVEVEVPVYAASDGSEAPADAVGQGQDEVEDPELEDLSELLAAEDAD